ncbi:putative cryptochrome DASH, mitochondrial [Glarea lozoyensis 74030]|uniref:Cryptochrome DASH n=1 Tax=Glarea lozoyensis (strain ATCC 74030 / MF5533) TaxID=1104152 RepID=H0EUY5_GLAL7|nr:putative cryptochrome DASH, mitochondrial [Glarea lozoyensis 74030]
MGSQGPETKVLIYLLRKDLRVSDNPVLHALAKDQSHGFTHLLPLYVFQAQQIEVKGFIPEGEAAKSPFPEARSQVAGFWRTGPHRVKFVSESVWDMKKNLQQLGSDLCIRAGMADGVLRHVIDEINQKSGIKVGAVWMTAEEGVEEKREERAIRNLCDETDTDFKLFVDEKYFIDDDPQDAPNVFTEYRNKVEPLREAPRAVLATPEKDSLPQYPEDSQVPAQESPFTIPDNAEGLLAALMKPLTDPLIKDPPKDPGDVQSAHPFKGGETAAQDRLEHIIASGSASSYKDSRNGLLGLDFSTKLSSYLVYGCITSRQIHTALLAFEDGTDDGKWKGVTGHGKGENPGTKSIRFELLWRDYMRLCNMKFGPKLFLLSGFRDENPARWATPGRPSHGYSKEQIQEMVERYLNGTTGMGLIDASQRELFHTGYTSNRARQNSASFLAKHLWIDWRIGAEWYESMLADYDVSSNWGNWQYLAGVGNDPRGEARVFNPVKQAYDYDPAAAYVKAWVPELRGLTDPGEAFQPWTIRDEQRKKELGLAGLPLVEKPLKRIDFTVGKRGKHLGRGRGGRGGGGNYGGARDENKPGEQGMGRSGGQSRGGYGGRGYGGGGGKYGGSSRGYNRGYGRGPGEGGGREFRTGMMDKERAYAQDL